MIGGEGALCDRCADERIASATGWPTLGDPPPPDVFRGPDGTEHRMVYRAMRAPGGIEVVAAEDDWAVDDGYRLVLLGPHDADVAVMWDQVRDRVRDAIAVQYLEHHSRRDGWIIRGDEVEGRLVRRDDGPGHDVVVDGRRLTWEEFGDTLEPFEGWTFRLSILSRGRDRRPITAVVANLSDPRDPGRKKAADRIRCSMRQRSQ